MEQSLIIFSIIIFPFSYFEISEELHIFAADSSSTSAMASPDSFPLVPIQGLLTGSPCFSNQRYLLNNYHQSILQQSLSLSNEILEVFNIKTHVLWDELAVKIKIEPNSRFLNPFFQRLVVLRFT